MSDFEPIVDGTPNEQILFSSREDAIKNGHTVFSKEQLWESYLSLHLKLAEALDIMAELEDIHLDDYDSFTLQPLRLFIQKMREAPV